LRLDERSTGLNEVAEVALAAPVKRGPIRRKFEPVGAH
jgi:hypothetical protein